jgi:hypothetical protein
MIGVKVQPQREHPNATKTPYVSRLAGMHVTLLQARYRSS